MLDKKGLLNIARANRGIYQRDLSIIKEVVSSTTDETLDSLISHRFVAGVVVFDLTFEEVKAIVDEELELDDFCLNPSTVVRSDLHIDQIIIDTMIEYAKQTTISAKTQVPHDTDSVLTMSVSMLDVDSELEKESHDVEDWLHQH